MRVLFDQGVPVPLRSFIKDEVVTCHERGWSNLSNGELLGKADGEFDAFITTDKNLGYQQNLKGLRIAILLLPTTRWPELQAHGDHIAGAIIRLKQGDFVSWEIPGGD